jgi:hypothetical protein
MSRLEQCENCGAVLLPEDTFCGECGAPRPEATSSASPDAGPPASSLETTPAEAPEERAVPATTPPGRSTRSGWRAAFIALMVVGLLVCILGILAFVLLGASETEGFTAEDNWLISAVCCLLPMAGSGLALLLAGAGIWFVRLRES